VSLNDLVLLQSCWVLRLCMYIACACIVACRVEAVEVRSDVCGEKVESVLVDPRLEVLDSNLWVAHAVAFGRSL
jgi:hypothetical protein